MSALAWHAVELGAAQKDEVRELFSRVFGGELPPALWHWKYGDGRGLATGTRGDDGRLLAHYGGTVRTLLMGGTAVAGVQLGDVMVDQAVRGILSRRGPFATAARSFLERHVGTPQGFACGFGFPNERAGRLGEALGLYVPVGPVVQVRWPGLHGAQALEARARWRLTPLDWSQGRTLELLDGLWQGLRSTALARQCVLPQRDGAWWRHRFGNHPQAPYRCFWVHQRVSGRLWGAVALRPAHPPAGEWEVLDWLALPQHMGEVAAAARGLCTRGGASAMGCWLSQPLATLLLAHRLLADGATTPACMATMTVRRSPSLPAPGAPQPWWWLTGGDTDFR